MTTPPAASPRPATAPEGYDDPALQAAAGGTMRPGGLDLTDRAVARCRLQPGALVLDVGCGTGATVRHLAARHGLRAVGIDSSSAVTAGHRRPGTALLRADARRLPLADGALDAVLAECVLSATGATDQVLAEVARLLRPGGLLVVTDLYARRADGVPLLRALPAGSCLRGVEDGEALAGALHRHGFAVRDWEDHSPRLAGLAARLLWAQGTAARLWAPEGSDPGQVRAAVRAARPGYLLLIAELIAETERG